MPHLKQLKEFHLHQVTVNDTIALTQFLRIHRGSLTNIQFHDIDVSGEGEEWTYLIEELGGMISNLKGLDLQRLMRLQSVILEYFTFTRGGEGTQYSVPINGAIVGGD